MPEREEIPAFVHVSEEEQEKEDDGLFQFLHVCQVSSRTSKLHRSTSNEYTRTSSD